MSAIAAVLLDKGYQISGSDAKTSFLVENLRSKGAVIFCGHAAENIGTCEAVVVSSAIDAQNPEIIAAQQKHIKIYHRSDLLAELLNGGKGIAVAGSHGKTTTSSMLSVIFDHAGLAPTVLIGGIVDYFKSNAQLGKGDYVIAEADESDGSFLKFKPYLALVTNIEDDHMDHYGSMDNLMQAFKEYIAHIVPGGMAILCLDHPQVAALAKDIERPYLSYAIDAPADYLAKNIVITKEGTTFEVFHHGEFLGQVQLAIPGCHNVLNALGAFAAAHFAQIAPAKIIAALKVFHGANRRFQTKKKTADYWIVDDYAHHPTEIKMTLRAAQQTKPHRLICIFQPHRYTRTKLLAEEFGMAFQDADLLILTDIYSAGEKPLAGITGQTLVEATAKHGKKAVYIEQLEQIAPYLKKILQPGDMVITMGAGNVYLCGETLANQL